MRLHQNVQTIHAKKTSTLTKLGLALLLSLMLLTASISFNTKTSFAATAHLDALQSQITSVKIATRKASIKHVAQSENKLIVKSQPVVKSQPTTTPVDFVAPQAAAASDTASIIRQVFGSYSDQAMRIAMCESSMNPNATNSYAIDNSHAAGLFQILYPSTWYGTSQANASPYDATANTKAAHEIFVRDGYSWREWQCQP